MNGGAGIDTVSYAGSPAAVTVSLTGGTCFGGDAQGDQMSRIENLIGSGFGDLVFAEAGANSLSGGGGDDTMFAGQGNDTLEGGAGADQLIGNIGFDYASYAASPEPVSVGLFFGLAFGGDAEGDQFTGVEGLIGSPGSDSLIGEDNNNVLRGENGNDTLLGDATVSGAGGRDVLWGGTGNDNLNGAGGADELRGDAGDDVFAFASLQSEPTAPDRILDLEGAGAPGGDQIAILYLAHAFEGYADFNTDPGSDLPAPPTSSVPIWYTFDGANTYVAADVNRDWVLNAGDVLVQLPGEVTLVAADFL